MKITDSGLEITTPEEAICFLGKNVNIDEGTFVLTSVLLSKFELCTSGMCYDLFDYPYWVPKETVKEVLTPKEGDAVFFVFKKHPEHLNDDVPDYAIYIGDVYEYYSKNGYVILKANSLIIGKTVGELRRLWQWCGGEG